MSRPTRVLADVVRLAWAALRAGAGNVTGHWALAVFSVVAAFGVWVAIQDVDNPQVEGLAPASGGVQVQAVNLPDGFLVDALPSVKVRVEARKDVLAELRPSDFKAEVNVRDAPRDGETSSLPVQVESRRDRVRVISVEPANVQVALIRGASREVQVTYRVVAAPPTGYQLDGEPLVQPGFVTIRGRSDLVESVKSVAAEVNLASARDQTVSVQADLAAYSADGNVVQVQMDSRQAQLTFKIAQVFSQRALALSPVIVGTPAPGFIVTGVTIDPPVVLVSGLKSIIDGLTLPLNLEKLDVTGARERITQTKQIERPPNVSIDRPSVVVRVEISPLDCGAGQPAAGCEPATLLIAPAFENAPAGLVVDGAVTVQVRVSGPISQVAALKPGDVKATVSLSGASAGTGLYPVRVTVPPGLRAEPVDPVTITLRLATP